MIMKETFEATGPINAVHAMNIWIYQQRLEQRQIINVQQGENHNSIILWYFRF